MVMWLMVLAYLLLSSHAEDTLFDVKHCGHINAVCGMAVSQQQAELSSENLTIS